MASDQVLLGFAELERLKQVPVAELAEAVAGGKGFYGEGDIPLLGKEG